MPARVTYVTEEHFFFVEGNLTYSTGYPRGGGCQGSWGGMVRARARAREAEAWCLRK